MKGSVAGFVIWAIVGAFIIGIGIFAFFSKKTIGFWANAKPIAVKDLKRYNHAVGKLFIAYGLIFIALGTPMLMGQNTPYILLSMVGVMVESIAAMIIYTLCIEKKYRK